MNLDAESIPLLVTFGYPGDATFNLRFRPEHRDEILALLDDHALEHGAVLESSAEVELAIEAVKVIGVGGGLAALASVIKTFVHRHDGKRVVLSKGEIEEVSGFSAKQIEQLLTKRASQQVEADLRWHEAVEKITTDGDE